MIDTSIQAIANNMVFVEGGSFLMGSNDGFKGDYGNNGEKPIHTVNLHSFYIARYPVTQAQWRAVMGSDPSELYNKGCDQCPVERVNWDDVQDFLQKLNAKHPPSGGGGAYRLPTEAEWEYAARGGNKSKGYKYAGSDDIDEVAWYEGSTKIISERNTKPIGLKKPNELGLYDMSGNVSEWCHDWYDYVYYKNSPSTNPQGAIAGYSRILRGGSWSNREEVCRVWFREHSTPTSRISNCGFRLTLSEV